VSVGRRAQRLEMVQLTGVGASIVIWVYFATNVMLALWTLDGVKSPWPTAIALAVLCAVCVAATLDTGDRISRTTTLLILVSGPLMSLLVSWNLVYGGYTQWYFGAGTIALFYLGLRGRIGLAWIGYAVLSTTILVWGTTTDIGFSNAVVLVARQAPILLVGTLFATGLRRTGDEIEKVTAAASMGAIAEASTAAARRERDQRLTELGGFATDLLEKLASGAPISAEDRIEFAVAEAEVRDSVRARSLRIPAVVTAAREARRRGVEVVLLDDAGPGANTPDELERVGQELASVLDSAKDGRITARLLPGGRSSIATIVMDGSSYERRDVVRD
jgi:hypothetical protein